MTGLKIAAVAVVLTSLFCCALSGWLVTAPQVLYAGTTSRIHAHFYGKPYNEEDYWSFWMFEPSLRKGNISVSLENRERYLIAYVSKKLVVNTHQYVDIEIPEMHSTSLPPGGLDGSFLEVTVNGHRRKQANVIIKSPTNIVIQIEKPIYNPGQTVRVRVIGVNRDLKPVIGKVDRIYVQDPKGIRLMQWDDIDFKNGIANVEMVLSKNPELGDWTVYVYYKGYEVMKKFAIKKYVHSKFNVNIEHPSLITFTSEGLDVTICARYSHGQSVKGKLNAVINIEYSHQKNLEKAVLQFGRRKAGKCPKVALRHNCTLQFNHRCAGDEYCPENYKCCYKDCHYQCIRPILIKYINFQNTNNRKKIYLQSVDPFSSKSSSSRINGCVKFSFSNQDIGLSNFKNRSNEKQYFIKITANVTEDITGLKQSSIGRIAVIDEVSVQLNFEIGTPPFYKPDCPFYGQLHVTRAGGEAVSGEQVIIEAKTNNGTFIYNSTLQVLNGIVDFDIPEISADSNKVFLTALYGTSGNLKADYEINPNPETRFLLLIKRMKPVKPGKSFKVSFLTNEGSELINKTLFNQVICGGEIISYGRSSIASIRPIKPRIGEGSIQLNIKMKTLVSSCRLLVYYIKKDEEKVVADVSPLKIQHSPRRNLVKVQFNQNRRSPGEPIQISIKAAPGSTVALSAVDKRFHSKTQDFNMGMFLPKDYSDQAMKFCGYPAIRYHANTPFAIAGLVHFSDKGDFEAQCQNLYDEELYRSSRYKQEIHSKDMGQPTILNTPYLVIKEREVSETWLWTEETVSTVTGERIITAQVPDPMTSWELSAFAMSATHGIGIAKPDTLSVLRPLFVSVTLPYAAIRGEKVNIVTTVFSSMTPCATVMVNLRNISQFQLISGNEHFFCICGNESKSVKHVIKLTEVGQFPLTVTVKNVLPSLCNNPSNEPPLGVSDTVKRIFRVEPEGEPKEYTYSELFCPKKGSLNDEIRLDLPKDVIPDSVYATVSLTGDLMGPTLKGHDKIVRLPTGCGEQNMVHFAPNIYVMKYINSTDLNIDGIFRKAKSFLEKGYQQELDYKRKDGSYSAYGDTDEQGSLWLTAFVLRSFSQASQFTYIDKKEIQSITKWIQSKQLDNGCFEKHGNLFRKELKGGVSTNATLTAYVVIALLESNVDSSSDVIVGGLRCIVNQQNNLTDSYSDAIIAYALTLAKHPGLPTFLTRLQSKAIVKDGKMHWEKDQKPRKISTDDWVQPYRRSSSINIEMTGYALLAMIGDGTDSTVIYKASPIVKWLSNQRNALGGFASTQDTCVALQALSVYARYVYGDLVDHKIQHTVHGYPTVRMDVRVGDNNTFSHNFRITHKKRLVAQKVEVPSKLLPVKLQISTIGRGCALMQADVSYSIKRVLSGPSFKLSATVSLRKDKTKALKTDVGEELCHPLQVNVCAQWLEAQKSGMAVIEVKLVSGFRPDEESLEKLMDRADIKLMRFEIEHNKVVFYFNEIKKVCLSFGLDQTSVVKDLQPALVTAYEYYDTDNSGSAVYYITDKLCETSSAHGKHLKQRQDI